MRSPDDPRVVGGIDAHYACACRHALRLVRARRCSFRAVEWLGEADIQIGAYDAPPPAELSRFLAGFVDGLAAHAAVREAELLEVDPSSAARDSNPTRRVSFRFQAESYPGAERLASDELRDSGLRAGMEALDPSLRRFGWTVSLTVQPL